MNTSWRVLHAKLSRATLCLALVLLPFTIKGCHIALITLVTLWLIEGEWEEKLRKIRTNNLLILLLAFGFLNVVGVLYSSDSTEAWFSLEKKVFLLLVPVALATTSVRWEERHVRIMCYTFLVGCVTGIIICFASAGLDYQHFTEQNTFTPHANYLDGTDFANGTARNDKWLFYSYAGLSNGLKIHPSYFALYLAFCLIFLIHERCTRSHRTVVKIALALAMIIITVTVVFLSSKIVMLGLGIICVLAVALYFSNAEPRKYAPELTAVLIVIPIVVLLNPVSRYRTLNEPAKMSFEMKDDHLYTTSVEIRGSLWWMSWKAYQRGNPIFGTGPGDVRSAIKTVSDEHNIKNVLETYDPHNQFLYILVANGVLGLAIFMWYLIILFIRAIKRANYLMIAFMILFISVCLTESALELQKGVVFFAIMHSMLTFSKPLVESSVPSLKLSSAAN